MISIEKTAKLSEFEKLKSILFVKNISKSKLIKCNIEDIFFIEASLNYIIIYHNKEKHLCYITLKEMEKRLELCSFFVRIHKSFIININKIESIQFGLVNMENGVKIAIGKTYKTIFLSRIHQLTLNNTNV